MRYKYKKTPDYSFKQLKLNSETTYYAVNSEENWLRNQTQEV